MFPNPKKEERDPRAIRICLKKERNSNRKNIDVERNCGFQKMYRGHFF